MTEANKNSNALPFYYINANRMPFADSGLNYNFGAAISPSDGAQVDELTVSFKISCSVL